jgi:orotate phosphoribosyltransferase-like protein
MGRMKDLYFDIIELVDQRMPVSQIAEELNIPVAIVEDAIQLSAGFDNDEDRVETFNWNLSFLEKSSR